MSITLSPKRFGLSEESRVRPKHEDRDFVAMFGFADGPMAGKRPSRGTESEAIPLSYEATPDLRPVD